VVQTDPKLWVHQSADGRAIRRVSSNIRGRACRTLYPHENQVVEYDLVEIAQVIRGKPLKVSNFVIPV